MKTGSNYVFELDSSLDVSAVRRFLELDHTRDFILVSLYKIKVHVNNFKGDRDFLTTFLQRIIV
jgi:hypothetical protein